MRPDCVVVLAPPFDDDPGLLQRVENLAVEQLVAKLRVEALAIAVLPRAAGHDVGRSRPDSGNPLTHRPGNELWAVVGTNVAGHAAQDEQVGKRVDHVDGFQLPSDPDRQAFPGELVDDVEHSEAPSVVGAVLNEVVGPDMVGMFRAKPDAGVLVAPEPPALGLLVRNLQPLASPDPLDPLTVYRPAGSMQHRRDAAIAVAAILGGERDDVGGQRRFIIRSCGDLALCGSVLAENKAGPSLGHVKFGNHMIHAGTATRGA